MYGLVYLKFLFFKYLFVGGGGGGGGSVICASSCRFLFATLLCGFPAVVCPSSIFNADER